VVCRFYQQTDWRHVSWRLIFVARSKQVYMKWWQKHCLLLSILPG
jgi:hypothetical protein